MLNQIRPSLPNEWASAFIKHIRAANISVFIIPAKLFDRNFYFQRKKNPKRLHSARVQSFGIICEP